MWLPTATVDDVVPVGIPVNGTVIALYAVYALLILSVLLTFLFIALVNDSPPSNVDVPSSLNPADALIVVNALAITNSTSSKSLIVA